MGVNGGALQLCAVYKSRILLQVKREKSVLALQVMHAASEKCNEIKGLYGKIIITMYSTKLYRKKNNHLFVVVGIVHLCCALSIQTATNL